MIDILYRSSALALLLWVLEQQQKYDYGLYEALKHVTSPG